MMNTKNQRICAAFYRRVIEPALQKQIQNRKQQQKLNADKRDESDCDQGLTSDLRIIETADIQCQEKNDDVRRRLLEQSCLFESCF